MYFLWFCESSKYFLGGIVYSIKISNFKEIEFMCNFIVSFLMSDLRELCLTEGQGIGLPILPLRFNNGNSEPECFSSLTFC